VVLVDVTDVNDNVPECVVTSDFNTSIEYTFPSAEGEGLVIVMNLTVAENVAKGTAIAQLNATDKDDGANAEISFVLISTLPDASDSFVVDNSTGTVTLSAALDREQLETYIIVLAAVDGGNPKLQQNITLSLIVSDINDVTPNFTQSLYEFTLPEDVAVGTVVGTVLAKDGDSEDNFNNVIDYSLQGLGNENFNISETSGEIVVAVAMDREMNASFELSVIGSNTAAEEAASDADFEDGNATIKIEITDINDNAPVMDESFAIEVKENAANGTVVLQLAANDPDVGAAANVTFTITSGNEDGCFDVSSANDPDGELLLTCILDRENESSYSIGIAAQDSAACVLEKGNGATDDGSACISKTVVNVTVIDVNDFAPTVTILPDKPVVPENATLGTIVVKTQVSDLDQEGTNNSKTRLELSGGDGCFEINDKGALLVNCSLDREELASSYALEITAFDYGVPELNSTVSFVVNISDVQDNAPTTNR
jgi:hypothetical protein